MKNEIVGQLLASSDLPLILEELNQKWQEEQKRRHQFWDEVSDNIKAEFINGEVIYHSPVKKKHNAVHFNLLMLIGSYVKNNSLGFIGFEKIMTRFTRNDYEPDICFWQQEKARHFTPDQYIFPVPDFIVEILSGSTEKTDRGVKKEDYARHGVAEYWIVDTDNNIIEQYLLSGNEYNPPLKLKTGQLSSQVIQGFSINVEEIFR